MMYLIQSKFADKSYTLAYDIADTTGKRRWDNRDIKNAEVMNWSTPAFAGFFDKNITTLFGPDFRQLVDLTSIKF